MKKIYLYFIYFISTLAGELDLGEVIEEFDRSSPFIKINRLEVKKFQKEEKGLRKNRNQKIDYRGEVFKESSSDKEITRNYDNVEKGQLTLMYDVLYYESVYEFEESNNYIDRGKGVKENRIGVRKILNDLVYSEKDYERNYIKIKERMVINDLAYSYIDEVDRIIDSYKEILSIQQSIKVDEESLGEYWKLYKIAREKERLGEGLKLETDYLGAEAMEVEERLNYSKNLKKIKIFQLGEAVGSPMKEDRVFRIFPELGEVSPRVNDYDLKKSRNEVEMIREEVKLKKRSEQPELIFGGDYDTERELWSMRVTLNGSLFDYKLESALGESNVLISSEEADYLERVKTGELKILISDYSYLKNNLRVKEFKKKNREKTVEIAREMYRLGYITAKDLIDEKNDYRETKMEYLEVLNSLGAFEYKMYMRERIGEIDMMSF